MLSVIWSSPPATQPWVISPFFCCHRDTRTQFSVSRQSGSRTHQSKERKPSLERRRCSQLYQTVTQTWWATKLYTLLLYTLLLYTLLLYTLLLPMLLMLFLCYCKRYPRNCYLCGCASIVSGICYASINTVVDIFSWWFWWDYFCCCRCCCW